MSWSRGEALLSEVVEATWPLIEDSTSYAERVDWLARLIDAFGDEDADIDLDSWRDDPWAEEFAEAYSDLHPELDLGDIDG